MESGVISDGTAEYLVQAGLLLRPTMVLTPLGPAQGGLGTATGGPSLENCPHSSWVSMAAHGSRDALPGIPFPPNI